MNQHVKNAVIGVISSMYSTTFIVDIKSVSSSAATIGQSKSLLEVIFYSCEYEQYFCVLVDVTKKQIIANLDLDEEDIISAFGEPWNYFNGEVLCN